MEFGTCGQGCHTPSCRETWSPVSRESEAQGEKDSEEKQAGWPRARRPSASPFRSTLCPAPRAIDTANKVDAFSRFIVNREVI